MILNILRTSASNVLTMFAGFNLAKFLSHKLTGSINTLYNIVMNVVFLTELL